MGEIISSGAVSVTSGMTLTSPDVIWEGIVLVSSGGKVVSATVSYGGLVVVSSGGTATYARIADSATAYVLSGAVMYAPGVLTRSGFVTVQGGSVYSAVLESGGSMNVSGFSNHTGYVSGARLVDNGLLLFDRYTEGTDIKAVSGSVTVVSGGHIKSTHIGGSSINSLKAAYLTVSAGGTADRTITTSDGLMTVSSGGLAREAVVSSGGSLYVSSGGTASGVTAELGGEIYVASGGTALQIRENGGCVLASDENVTYVPNVLSGLVLSEVATVHSGTTATETILNTGVLYVYEGGSAEKTLINSGRLTLDGGTANSTTVFANFTVSGGSATSTTVHSGGGMEVRESGAATGVTLNSGGGMSVRYGGSATDVTVNVGAVLYVISGTALQVRENGGYVDVDSNSNVTFVSNVLSGLVLNADATVHSGTTATDTTLNASGVYLAIFSGGIANGTTVNSGARLRVSAGAQVDSTTVNDGSIDLFGTADHTTISGGKVWVSSGATADNTAIAGGDMIVYSGATANSTAITSGGLFVYGGIVNSTTVNDGRVLVKGDGATANSTFVSGGVMDVSSGTAKTVKVYGGTVNVFADGTATGVTASGGTVNVSSGAVLNSASAQDGRIRVYSGGTAVANRATKTGRIVANAGGALLSCVAISSGRVELEGGAALATEVGAAGMMLVEGAPHLISGGKDSSLTNGVASNTRIHLGAIASVGSGGAMIDTVVGYSAASLSPREPKIGEIELPSGLLERAGLYINSSGIATGVTASKGAIVAVDNKGVLVSAKVSSGATAQVLAGGSARTLAILRGGSATIAGGATDVRIASAAKAVIGNGGVASTVTVSTGGLLRANAGALVANVSVASGGIVTGVFAGLASQAITLEDGILDFDVSALGADGICVEQLNTAFAGTYSCTLTVGDETASGTYKLAGDAAGFDKTITVQNASGEALGALTVDGEWTTLGDYDCKLTLSEENLLSVRVRTGGVDITGDLTSEFILTDGMVGSSVNVHTSDGRLIVSSGAVATQTTASEKGTLVVSEGGAADNTLVSGGQFTIFRGTADNTTVSSYASMTVNSGTVDHTTIGGLCLLDLKWGATANNTTLAGSMYMSSGTTASNTTVISSGMVYLGSGIMEKTTLNDNGNMQVGGYGTVNETVLNGHAHVSLDGGKANNTTINGGGFYLSKAAVANNTKANGGLMSIKGGAVANNTNVSRGDIYVYDGGSLIDTVVSTGRLYISSGGTMSGTIFSSGGLFISCGAVIDTVVSYGNIYISEGGALIDTVISGGSELVIFSGGKITGRLTIENGATMSAVEGGIVDFDLTRTSAGAAALVNDISRVTGTPLYTLTVGGSQADGTYKLAGDAAGFDKTITVQNESGEALGTLTVGQTVNIGSTGYTLNLNSDDVLSVSVGAVAPGPTPEGIAKSDIDGNGISDVMFVWTGNNYQHGYWMNGTSEWQSAGSNHPADWDNLGCHDMTGNGKADSVLFGNVTSEAGIKGAYIGFYTDAIDNPDGSTWVNIGYLTNEDDIQWKNKVGNLTGNASGINSIVWYAPELYALGVWKDGKEDWATLSSSFGGSDWTLVGCGDFDGDGKDSVLMTYNDGQMFYAVGLDGTAASLGSTNWSGWEVRAIGDFAGDKKDDIVLFHKATGSMVMCANGNLDSFVSLAQLDAEDWFVVGAGDYNGDSKDDLLVRQYSTGMLGYYSAGDTSNWVELGRGVDMNWTVIA